MKKQKTGLTRAQIGKIVDNTVSTYSDQKGINHINGKNIPSRNVIYGILDDFFEILFPGYVEEGGVSWTELPYFVGEKINSIYIRFSEQAERALRYQCAVKDCVPDDTDKCRRCAQKSTVKLLRALPEIRGLLKEDVEAAYEGDPAAASFDEIILSYPVIDAIATHRLAHILFSEGIPLIPRMMSERAHSRTGIDIHPGAGIGRHFFIDHATGVVIGETTIIGDNVKLYQGVTIGALSIPRDRKGRALKKKKRHPTLKDNVTVYGNATILGGDTVIGKDAVIGGNVWLTKSVPEGCQVKISKPELVIKNNKKE